VIFVSILFLNDFARHLFREFSLTLVAAMLVSLAVSLSLSPSLAARLLRLPDPHRVVSPWVRLGRFTFAGLRRLYLASLTRVFHHLPLTLGILALVIGLNVLLMSKVPRGIVPEQDTAQLRGFARGDDGLSFQIMQPKIDAYRELLMNDPGIEDIIGFIGGQSGVNNAFIMIKVKPLAERKLSSREIINRLRRNQPKVPGGMLFLWVDQDIRIGGGSDLNCAPMIWRYCGNGRR